MLPCDADSSLQGINARLFQPTPFVQLVDSELPDVVRGTAASALCRLLRCQPSCLPALLEIGGVELLAAGERGLNSTGSCPV